jgi:hypothetical protein
VAEGEVARDAAGELHSGVASVVDVGKVDDPVAGAVNDALDQIWLARQDNNRCLQNVSVSKFRSSCARNNDKRAGLWSARRQDRSKEGCARGGATGGKRRGRGADI